MIKILKATDGSYYYVVQAKNGRIMVTSETYRKKSNCEAGVESLLLLLDNPVSIVDETQKTPHLDQPEY